MNHRISILVDGKPLVTTNSVVTVQVTSEGIQDPMLDEAHEAHLNFTFDAEGLITDLIMEGDCAATSSSMYDELIETLK